MRPCPFCGQTPEDADVEMSEGETETWVTCPGCQAQGPINTIGCRDEEEDGVIDLEAEAIELWNRRVRTARRNLQLLEPE